MTADDELHTWVAAYVLGALEHDERKLFESHLEGCERCRAEVAKLAPIPGLLAHVDVDELTDRDVDVARRAIDAVHAELAGLRRARATWRALSVAAALALVVVLTVSLWPEGSHHPDAQPLAVGTTDVAGAWASVSARAWGTEISIGADGLPASERYHLVAIDASGTEQVAATWGPVEGHLSVTGATAFPIGELLRVVVTDRDGNELFVAV